MESDKGSSTSPQRCVNKKGPTSVGPEIKEGRLRLTVNSADERAEEYGDARADAADASCNEARDAD